MNKKGIQLSQAFGAVLTLVLVAILVLVGIVLFSSLHTSMVVANTAGSVANETGWLNSSGFTLDTASLEDWSFGSVTLLLNATANTSISTANASVSSAGLVTNASAVTYGEVLISYSYTYSAATSASNATDTMITNFSSYPALVGLVGTIIFLALVIGVLVASFVMGRNKGV